MSGTYFLIDMVAKFFTFAFAVRFLLQLCGVDFYNQLSQSIVAITNPVTEPLRKVLPRSANIDWASLLMVLAVNAAYVLLIVSLQEAQVALPDIALAVALFSVKTFLNVYMLSIFGEVILSWLGPAAHQSPLFPVVFKINSPILNRLRNVIPPMGGLDLSPMIAIVAVQFLRYSLPV